MALIILGITFFGFLVLGVPGGIRDRAGVDLHDPVRGAAAGSALSSR